MRLRHPCMVTTRMLAAPLVVAIIATTIVFNHASAKSGENRKPIRTCADVGLCQKGKRTMLLNNERVFSGWAMQYALARGCSLTKKREKQSRIVCPDTLSIPYAEPERVFELHDLPSVGQVGAQDVHAMGYDGTGVKVAIIDSGVDTTHPELVGVIQATANFTTESADDALGHGTHVAGIVAGQGINDFDGNRVLGIAPGVQLLVAKVCNSQGFCLEGDIDAGVEWAVAQGAQVINMSLGAGAFMDDCDEDPLGQEANWAVDQGVVVVAASGNQGESTEGVAAPGCGSKVISVGAVNFDDERASWSGYGGALELVAPGVEVLSSYPCAKVNNCPAPTAVLGNGTSMATPQVTGAVAAMLQADPTLTPQEVKEILIDTTTDLGVAGFDRFYGNGRLDVYAAIERVLQLLQEPPASSSSTPVSSSASSVPSSASSLSSVSSAESSTSSITTSSSMSSAPWSSSSDFSSTTSSTSSTTTSRSSWSRSSVEFVRPCAPSDWRCSEFHDCSDNGKQERECELKNERCTGAERARPPLERDCERGNSENHRNDDDRGRGNDHRSSDDDRHSDEDNSGPGNAQRRSLSDWIRWLRQR